MPNYQDNQNELKQLFEQGVNDMDIDKAKTKTQRIQDSLDMHNQLMNSRNDQMSGYGKLSNAEVNALKNSTSPNQLNGYGVLSNAEVNALKNSLSNLPVGQKKGGKVKAKKMASGGKIRGHGIERRGKTKGKFI